MMFELKLDPKSVKEPIISKIAIEKNVLINIVKASIGPREGEMIIEVEDNKAEEVFETFRKHGVKIVKLEQSLVRDEEKCTHCGACVSICPTEVFRFNKEKKVEVELSKCLHCGVCVKVCPFGALSLK